MALRLQTAVALLLVGIAGGACARAGEREVVTRLVHAIQAHDSAAVVALAVPGEERDLWLLGSTVPPGYVAAGQQDLRVKFVARIENDASYYVPARGTGRCTVGIIVSVVSVNDRIRVRGIDLRPDLIVPPDSLPC